MVPGGDLEFPGLSVTPRLPPVETAQFEMAFHLTEFPDRITGNVQYNSDLFDAATIERLLGHWSVMIEAVAANPDLKISEVPLLSGDERDEMLGAWNATAEPYAADKGVHHLIAETAAARPDATALVCGEASLTYAELDARANRLARHLKSSGVGRDTTVGLSLERSLDLVVGALGILKAGGAYVPMDPAYPRDRRGFMIEDSAAPVIVTASHLVADLPEHTAKVVRIDTDWPQIEALSDAPLLDEAFSPDQLAYVIFTSGSTGRPKGVMVEHRNASNFFTAMDGVIEPDRDDPAPGHACPVQHNCSSDCLGSWRQGG